MSPIGLSYHIEQHAEFPIASLFRIEVIETRLGPGITESFVRRNGFGRMSNEEGVVDGRIGQEGGRDERRIVVVTSFGSERRNRSDVRRSSLVEDVLQG